MKRTKKLLSLLLTIAIVLTIAPWSWISVSAYDEPMLNAEGYYELSTADHLYWFAEQVNSGNTSINGVLMNDIVVNEGDLSGYDGVSENNWKEWTPIGNESYFYSGTFDGDGYTVSGLYFNNIEANFIGFFGVVAGTIKNIGIENSYFKGNMAVGGICSYLYEGTVEKTYSSSTIVGTTYVGGICGFNAGITNSCYNNGFVSGEQGVGGLCGYNQSTIKNSYNTGNVKGTTAVGGVCGYGLATNCYYLINCATDESGIVQSQIGNEATEEHFSSGEICYALNEGVTDGRQPWYQNIDNKEKTNVTPQFSGGTVYAICEENRFSNTYKQSKHIYEDGICSVCGVYQYFVTEDNYVTLGLTQEYVGYYAISNSAQLHWFAEQVNNGNNEINGVLINDIVVNEGNLSGYDGISENEWLEWAPIGNSSTHYKGVFDGAGYTISGIYFNDTTVKHVGLFGYIDNATIKNIGIEKSYVQGNSYTSGICGYNNYGTIEECYNIGTIIGSSYDVGGICGYSNYGTIENCNNAGAINGSTGYAGGVCGRNSSGTIEKCYNNGTVIGGQNTGGVCGTNYEGTVQNCYNIGEVTGGERVGGICGSNNYGKIHYSYNLGEVKGSSYVGGICGSKNFDASLWYTYYLSDCAVDGNNVVQNGVGTSSAGSTNTTSGIGQSKTIEQFASGEVAYLLNKGVIDGTQVWYQNIDNGETVDTSPKFTGGTVYKNEVCAEDGLQFEYGNTVILPQHSFANGTCSICGEIEYAILVTSKNYEALGLTSDYIGYYAIYNAGQLYWFRDFVSGRYGQIINGVLMNDIVVNEGDLLGYDGESENTWEEWNSITSFHGTFDGRNYSISGLFMDGFISSNYGIIQNLGVINSYAVADDDIGGVCGQNSGTIKNCYNASTIKGTGQMVGGICGRTSGIIQNCYNTGTIISSNIRVGGISGYSDESAIIENCYNTGSVIGSQWVGGICGDGGKVKNCYNMGRIEGTEAYSEVGGICGSCTTIENCYNMGEIIGIDNVGSICGYSVSIVNCYYLEESAVDGAEITQNGVGVPYQGSVREDIDGATTAKTVDQFASGEVAYLLNEGVTDGTQVWYQNIDNGETVDTTPKFVGGTAYQYYNICPDEEVAYSNTENKKGKMHSFESGVCTECSVSFINPWKSQIRFDKNEDGTFAGTFDYRVLATITSDDLAALFDTGNSTVENEVVHAIVEAGFVMTKGTDVSGFDYETAKNVVKGTSNDYTKVPVDWISTSFDSDPQSSGKGDYVISCIVENIPETDKNMCLATMAYIVYNGSDGNLCYMFYPTIDSVCFEGLYEQYYPLAFPS